MNKKTKTKIKRYVGLLLSAALLITGLLAFLTATDSKTNTFTIGDVKITLWEEFDVDNDGNITDGTGGNPDNIFGKNEEPPVVQNILPGDEVIKAPYIENTGTNDAWVYMIVSVPTADISEFENLHSTNAETLQKTIDVKAYAIQDKYNGETNDTASEVWAAYVGTDSGTGNVDYTDLLGNAVTPDSGRTEIFEVIGLDVYNAETNPNGEWDAIDTYYGADGNNYYIYARREMLPAEDDATASPAVSDETSKLFTAVRLSPLVGEHQAAPFMPVEPDNFAWESVYEPYFLTPEKNMYSSYPEMLDEFWGVNDYNLVDEKAPTVDVVANQDDFAATDNCYHYDDSGSGHYLVCVVGGDINSDGHVTVEDRNILSQMLSLSDPGTGDWGMSEVENILDVHPDATGDVLKEYNYYKYAKQLAADIDGVDGLTQGDIDAFDGVIAGTHKIVYRSQVNSSGSNPFVGVRQNGSFTVVTVPAASVPTEWGFGVPQGTEYTKQALTDFYEGIYRQEGLYNFDDVENVGRTLSIEPVSSNAHSGNCRTGDGVNVYINGALAATQYIVVPGDVTCDGAVNNADYVMMKEMLGKIENERDWGWTDSGLSNEEITRNIRMSSLAANVMYDTQNENSPLNVFDEYDVMAMHLFTLGHLDISTDGYFNTKDMLNGGSILSWTATGYDAYTIVTLDDMISFYEGLYQD